MRQEICDVMRECYLRNWITTRDGNCSVRYRNRDYMYITPSGHRKNILDREDLVKVFFKDNIYIIPDNSEPSGELHMHYLLQKENVKTKTVLHAHPTHIVAAMYAGFDLQIISNDFPEVFRYTKVGETVDALPATTVILGEATYKAIGGKFDIVGQKNHGVTAVAPDPWSAFEHIERLDHVCKIVLTSGVRPSAFYLN